MRVLQPTTWAMAVQLRSAWPHAEPIAGATAMMPRLRLPQNRPDLLLDLSLLKELRGWRRRPDAIWIGAGTTYAEIVSGLAADIPVLAEALRGAGPPQVRNRATIGGALGAALPAGNCHPPLLATRATVEAVSLRGTRLIPAREFYLGERRTALAPDELIRGVVVPIAKGPQRYVQVSARRAAAPAIISFAISVPSEGIHAGTGIGGGAVPVAAKLAEHYLSDWLESSGWRSWPTEIPGHVVARFSALATTAVVPISNESTTDSYQRYAAGVLARRALLSCQAG